MTFSPLLFVGDDDWWSGWSSDARLAELKLLELMSSPSIFCEWTPAMKRKKRLFESTVSRIAFLRIDLDAIGGNGVLLTFSKLNDTFDWRWAMFVKLDTFRSIEIRIKLRGLVVDLPVLTLESNQSKASISKWQRKLRFFLCSSVVSQR